MELNAEQTKKALECCADTSDIMKCQSCPYIQPRSGCSTSLVRDALALINEQEQKIEEITKIAEFYRREAEKNAECRIKSAE